MNMKSIGTLCAAVFTMVILSATLARADVPSTLSYQGSLYLNSDGTQVNGMVNSMTIKLWSAATGGVTPAYTQAFNNVYVTDGRFAVVLSGTDLTTLLDSALGSSLWVGVTVNTEAEMTPRQQLTSVPFAVNAKFAEFATGSVSAATITAAPTVANPAWLASIDAAKITTGTIDVARVPSLDAAKITTGTINIARLPNLDATKITSGAMDGARISGNIAGSKITGNAPGVVPIGGIIMWSGTVATIPSGWALCNGQTANGIKTPNLLSKFIIGGYSSGTYIAGTSEGGSATHTLTIAEMPSHKHNYDDTRGLMFWSGTGTVTVTDNTGASEPNLYSSKTLIPLDGGGQPHNNMPPYFALAYIMRYQ